MFSLFKSIGHGFVAVLIALNIIPAPVQPQTPPSISVVQPVTVQTETVSTKPPSTQKTTAPAPQSKPIQTLNNSVDAIQPRQTLIALHDVALKMESKIVNDSKLMQERNALIKAYSGDSLSSQEKSLFSSESLEFIEDGDRFYIGTLLQITNNELVDQWNNGIKFSERQFCDLNPEIAESDRDFCHSLFKDDYKTKKALTAPTTPSNYPTTVNCNSYTIGSTTNTNCTGY